jgi:hypothetical protein
VTPSCQRPHRERGNAKAQMPRDGEAEGRKTQQQVQNHRCEREQPGRREIGRVRDVADHTRSTNPMKASIRPTSATATRRIVSCGIRLAGAGVLAVIVMVIGVSSGQKDDD